MVVVDAWKRVVLEKFAVFSGRAGRAEFWWFELATVIVMILLAIVIRIVPVLGFILLAGYVLAIIVPSIAVAIRRLHDTNKSGWWLLIGFVPFGGIVLLVFYLLAGNAGSNSHGAPEPWPA